MTDSLPNVLLSDLAQRLLTAPEETMRELRQGAREMARGTLVQAAQNALSQQALLLARLEAFDQETDRLFPPAEPRETVVHAMWLGRSMCNKPGVPGSWGPHHKHEPALPLSESRHVNCEGCLAVLEVGAARERENLAMAFQGSRSEGNHHLNCKIYDGESCTCSASATPDGYVPYDSPDAYRALFRRLVALEKWRAELQVADHIVNLSNRIARLEGAEQRRVKLQGLGVSQDLPKSGCAFHAEHNDECAMCSDIAAGVIVSVPVEGEAQGVWIPASDVAYGRVVRVPSRACERTDCSRDGDCPVHEKS